MDLSRFLPGKKEKDEEYFWSLIIEPGWVQVGIWRIFQNTAQVVASSKPVSWELEDDLLSATDSILSNTIQGFPQDLEEPTKTVFAVVPSWVSGGVILPENLDTIKKLCEQLSLKPIGFVVLPESFSHSLKNQEGTTTNVTFIGVYNDNLEFSVFKLGNLVGNSKVNRSLSIIEDVAEGLSRFETASPLPSRILLYNGKTVELEGIRKDLLTIDWSEIGNVRFLHTPKIEVITPEQKIEAVSFAGAAEVSGVTNFVSENEPASTKSELSENEDPPILPREEDNNISELKAEELGFQVGSEVLSHSKQAFELPSEAVMTDDAEYDSSQDESEPKQKGFSFPVFSAPNVKMPRLKFPNNVLKPFIFAGVFLVILVGGLLSAWWFIPKAEVTVYIAPKTLNEEFRLKVDANVATSNPDTRVLKGKVLTTEVNNTQTATATGKKTVGEKAKGEITLYRIGTGITIPTGTTVTGPGQLKFTLDESVQVASGSASSPGNALAKITSAQIGPESNLAPGSTFSVGNYSKSDIEGKNEAAFSGGTSRDVTAVSAQDLKRVRTELEAELLAQATRDLESEVSIDDVFIPESVRVADAAEDFSHKLGDEVSTFELDLSLDIEAVAISKADLNEITKTIVSSKVPDGYVLRDNQIETRFTLEESDSGYEFNVIAAINLLPEINTDTIESAIVGRSQEVAQEYFLTQVPGFARAEIVMMPKLPGRLDSLPRVKGNIDVQIASER